MGFRRPAAIMAITGTLILGTAAAALADIGSGLAVSGNDCGTPPIVVQPQQYAEETGSATATATGAPTSVKWSIWTNSTDDLSTATRAIATQGSSVIQSVQNQGSAPAYYWGCLFNNSSVKVNWTDAIFSY
jgi:hypothetical protein